MSKRPHLANSAPAIVTPAVVRLVHCTFKKLLDSYKPEAGRCIWQPEVQLRHRERIQASFIQDQKLLSVWELGLQEEAELALSAGRLGTGKIGRHFFCYLGRKWEPEAGNGVGRSWQ